MKKSLVLLLALLMILSGCSTASTTATITMKITTSTSQSLLDIIHKQLKDCSIDEIKIKFNYDFDESKYEKIGSFKSESVSEEITYNYNISSGATLYVKCNKKTGTVNSINVVLDSANFEKGATDFGYYMAHLLRCANKDDASVCTTIYEKLGIKAENFKDGYSSKHEQDGIYYNFEVTSSKFSLIAMTSEYVKTNPTTTVATTIKATTAAATVATTMSPEQLESAFKTYEYKDVARLPDTYIAKFMKITGEVIQVMESGSTTSLRIIENSDYDKVWYVSYSRPDKAPRILEKDIVTVYGSCIGLYSYKSTSGTTISIPGVVGIDVKIINP